MAQIPASLVEAPFSLLLGRHLSLVGRGKVRDTYTLGNGLLLVVATDRVSVYDFVLNGLIGLKGAVLTALTHFWLTNSQVCQHPHHLVAAGNNIDRYLPLALRGNPGLQHRALVVKQLRMLPIELIVRGYLTGSGWKSYQQNGTVCGIQLPPYLHDGSRLNRAIFTPTTKENEGHDEHLNAAEVMAQYPGAAEIAVDLYQRAHDYALVRGVVIADTKFEAGLDENNGNDVIVLGDEVVTTDSSRFWDKVELAEALAAGRTPRSHDKQYVRDYMGRLVHPTNGLALPKLDPSNPEHVAWVHEQVVPDEVCHRTTGIYRDIFERLTGMSLGAYQQERLN